VRNFVDRAKVVMQDEACASTQGGSVNAWQGDDKICTLAGDPNQLPPAVMSYRERWGASENDWKTHCGGKHLNSQLISKNRQ